MFFKNAFKFIKLRRKGKEETSESDESKTSSPSLTSKTTMMRNDSLTSGSSKGSDQDQAKTLSPVPHRTGSRRARKKESEGKTMRKKESTSPKLTKESVDKKEATMIKKDSDVSAKSAKKGGDGASKMVILSKKEGDDSSKVKKTTASGDLAKKMKEIVEKIRDIRKPSPTDASAKKDKKGDVSVMAKPLTTAERVDSKKVPKGKGLSKERLSRERLDGSKKEKRRGATAPVTQLDVTQEDYSRKLASRKSIRAKKGPSKEAFSRERIVGSRRERKGATMITQADATQEETSRMARKGKKQDGSRRSLRERRKRTAKEQPETKLSREPAKYVIPDMYRKKFKNKPITPLLERVTKEESTTDYWLYPEGKQKKQQAGDEFVEIPSAEEDNLGGQLKSLTPTPGKEIQGGAALALSGQAAGTSATLLVSETYGVPDQARVQTTPQTAGTGSQIQQTPGPYIPGMYGVLDRPPLKGLPAVIQQPPQPPQNDPLLQGQPPQQQGAVWKGTQPVQQRSLDDTKPRRSDQGNVPPN